MLQTLEERAPSAALEVASDLVTHPKATNLVKANAVALLVRSEDARAENALASLPPKYKRLAATLRQQR